MTITAKVVADSVGERSPRLTTLQLRYPKFIHGELTTHRVFSRNASSSRAIPVERLIQDVIDDPVYPSFWGKNQAGMQAAEECDARIDLDAGVYFKSDDYSREEVWDYAREEAIAMARAFADAGYHKQIVNRLLEPFCHINVVVTATEWSNFFALRCHPAAQPEMRILAEAIRDAMAGSEPALLKADAGEWHLPYVDRDYENALVSRDDTGPYWKDEPMIKISVARCARVSYLTQEGREPTVAEDLALYDRLVGATPLHASPCEHQATPDTGMFVTGVDRKIQDLSPDRWNNWHLHGNLVGWIQYRKTLPGECQ